MARGRIIEKSISTSKKLSKVSDEAALLYTWIIPHTDDFGHLEAEPRIVKSIVVPLRDSMTLEVVSKLLNELYKVGLATSYTVDGDQYLEIYKFDEFQTFRTDRSRKVKYPLPPKRHTTDIPTGEIRHGREEKRSEVKRSEEKAVTTTALPDWLDKKKWQEWEKYRKEIKKKLTDSTIKSQIALLEKHKADHVTIIENSIQNGWTGLFELKEKKKGSEPYKNKGSNDIVSKLKEKSLS